MRYFGDLYGRGGEEGEQECSTGPWQVGPPSRNCPSLRDGTRVTYQGAQLSLSTGRHDLAAQSLNLDCGRELVWRGGGIGDEWAD